MSEECPAAKKQKTAHTATSKEAAAAGGGGCPMGFGANLSPSGVAPRPKRGEKPVHYHDYLNLGKILTAQKPLSEKAGHMAHDEMLFIIIHQTYELWFKQILHELNSCMRAFECPIMTDESLSQALGRLKRIVEIQRVLLDQLTILETMTPLSFLEFRDYLFPASGFQSLQFRLIENKLGLKRDNRLLLGQKQYETALKPDHVPAVQASESSKTLYELIGDWLERLHLVNSRDFNFWEEYKKSVKKMFEDDRQHVRDTVEKSQHASRLKEVDGQEAAFEPLFSDTQYAALLKAGKVTLSHAAAKAAIMINIYQDQAIFHGPHQLLTLLLDIDENLTSWRYKHALMVHRMLGIKTGTGGSSGYHYLRATASEHKVFGDLFNLSMFLIPKGAVPVLPKNTRQSMGFKVNTMESPTKPAKTPVA